LTLSNQAPHKKSPKIANINHENKLLNFATLAMVTNGKFIA
jgi:hypothetical protein